MGVSQSMITLQPASSLTPAPNAKKLWKRIFNHYETTYGNANGDINTTSKNRGHTKKGAMEKG
jgi:hypothetical protein